MSNQKIHLLPEHIIDQIKAGEVIERPANVIKELVENSIDANSSQIDIHVVNNGMDLISIEDNGVGIEHDDLPYAFLRHATSKIDKFDDIYHLFTYGFRGEALASMASIGKIQCTTTHDNQTSQITIEGAKVINHSKLSTKKENGTSMYIRDLFFNTPTRLKFVQSSNTEKNRLNKIIKAFLLTGNHIQYSVKWDELDKEIYPATEKLENRIKRVFNIKDHIDLVHFEQEYDEYQVSLYFTENSSRGLNNKNQFIFINGRFIVDKKIHNIIVNCLNSYWKFGEQGHYAIYINVPPEEIDVNVHPNKTLIKFYLPAKVFSLISANIKQGIQARPKSIQNNQIDDLADQSYTQEELLQEQSIEFKDLNFSDEDFQERVFHHIADGNNTSNSMGEVFKLTNNFYLLNFKSKYLLNSKLLIAHYLTDHFKADQIDVVPLLISEPFQVDDCDKIKLDELLKIGFELDPLDKKTLVLRTVPSFFNSIPFKSVVELMIQSSENLKLEKILQSADFSNISMFVVRDLISKFSISHLIEMKIAIELDENTLTRFFK